MSDDLAYVRHLINCPNPFFPWTFDESRDEYELRAEEARLRGDFGLDWMINGFPEQ